MPVAPSSGASGGVSVIRAGVRLRSGTPWRSLAPPAAAGARGPRPGRRGGRGRSADWVRSRKPDATAWVRSARGFPRPRLGRVVAQAPLQVTGVKTGGAHLKQVGEQVGVACVGFVWRVRPAVVLGGGGPVRGLALFRSRSPRWVRSVRTAVGRAGRWRTGARIGFVSSPGSPGRRGGVAVVSRCVGYARGYQPPPGRTRARHSPAASCSGECAWVQLGLAVVGAPIGAAAVT
jgi:hypothetical protein